MTIHDQMPHYILCNYWQVVNTGDREFLNEVWPALNHAMAYVLRPGEDGGMGMGGADGLATTPTADGLPGEDHADNWLDIINFGGIDAIINSYLITALNAMAEMATFLGGDHAAEAPKWRALHTKASLNHGIFFMALYAVLHVCIGGHGEGRSQPNRCTYSWGFSDGHIPKIRTAASHSESMRSEVRTSICTIPAAKTSNFFRRTITTSGCLIIAATGATAGGLRRHLVPLPNTNSGARVATGKNTP